MGDMGVDRSRSQISPLLSFGERLEQRIVGARSARRRRAEVSQRDVPAG